MVAKVGFAVVAAVAVEFRRDQLRRHDAARRHQQAFAHRKCLRTPKTVNEIQVQVDTHKSKWGCGGKNNTVKERK